MTDLSDYHRFIASKGGAVSSHGFTPTDLPSRLFEHQKRATEYALEKGRAALFLDTGLGKSGCEAVFADQARRETNKPALILTPLSINADVVAFVNNSWRNLDRKKDDETLEEYQQRLAAFQKYDEVSRDVIDTLSLQHDRFWLTHRYDKRGRTYVSGYHVNYQSNDWCKAVVEFADGEKLNG